MGLVSLPHVYDLDSERHHRLPNIQDGGQEPEVVRNLAIVPNVVVVPYPKQAHTTKLLSIKQNLSIVQISLYIRSMYYVGL